MRFTQEKTRFDPFNVVSFPQTCNSKTKIVFLPNGYTLDCHMNHELKTKSLKPTKRGERVEEGQLEKVFSQSVE